MTAKVGKDCDPTEYMTQAECDRFHKEFDKSISAKFEDSAHDRQRLWRDNDAIWKVVEDIRIEIANLVKKVSARTILILLSVVFLLIGFIVVQVVLPERKETMINNELESIKAAVRGIAEVQSKHYKVSEDNNDKLSEPNKATNKK